MPENIETYLLQIIDGQRQQLERDNTVLLEVDKLYKTVEKLHDRLDIIKEITIIHSQEIKNLSGYQSRIVENCRTQHELIWTKMGERKKEAVAESIQRIKIWILAGILSSFGALSVVIFTTFLKK